jgi:hypothetical protein
MSAEANFILRARDRTQEAFASAESRMSRFSRMTRMSLGGLGAGLSVAGLVRYGRSALTTADQVDNLSQRMRLGHESVQSLNVLFREAGLSIESFQSVMDRLVVQQTRARNGNEAAIASFQAMGISLDDLRNSSPEQILEAVTRAMAQNGREASVAGAAQEILGTRSMRLEAVLQQLGSRGFADLNAHMLKTKQIMEGDLVRAGDKMEEGLSRAMNRLAVKRDSFFTKGMAGGFILGKGVTEELKEMSLAEKAQMLNPAAAAINLFRRRKSLGDKFVEAGRELFEPPESTAPPMEELGETIAEPIAQAGDDFAQKIKNAFSTFRAEDLVSQVQKNLLERSAKATEQLKPILQTINHSIQDLDLDAVGA